MKGWKRILIPAVSVLLLLWTAACVPAGPSSSQPQSKTYRGIDVSEPVTLNMYLLGDKPSDMDAVYEKVNAVLQETVNATLRVKFLPWDRQGEYIRLFLTGEDFDLIFTAGWCYYRQAAAMGGFVPLTQDLLSAYAPDIVSLLPDAAWTQAAVDGVPCMVPGYRNEYGLDVVGVRGDLMAKYGYEDISTPEELEAFLRDVAANETDLTPLGTQNGASLTSFYLYPGMHDVTGSNFAFFVYNMNDPADTEIRYTVDTDAFLQFARKMKEFRELGFWTQDTLSSQDTRADSWLQGRSAIMVWNIRSVAEYAQEINRQHPEWNATFVDPARAYPRPINAYTQNGMAVNASSRHPERALMVLNELMTNPTLQDLTTLGIQGVHWEPAGDHQYRSLRGASGYPPDSACNWGWSNWNLARSEYVEEGDAVYQKLENTLDAWDAAQTVPHAYAGFSFDSSPLASIGEKVDRIYTQYYMPIAAGMVEDPDQAVQELRQRLHEAGVEEILAEMQRQADAYLQTSTAGETP